MKQTVRAFSNLRVSTLAAVAVIGLAAVHSALAATPPPAEKAAEAKEQFKDSLTCPEIVSTVLQGQSRNDYQAFCPSARKLPSCTSVEGVDIHHFETKPGDSTRGRKILVFGLTHGDEALSGIMALEWIQRLSKLDGARNQWRIVPVLNPDGLRRNTRTNARGVDLNRNFPTKDWDENAVKYWNEKAKSDKRRFPGPTGGSEPETVCAMDQIKDFEPDFIVSIHTPYGVLDFDGPGIAFPKYADLPWRRLGNFPGSLGRYMWKDRDLPVLTIELRDKLLPPDQMQDMIGAVALQTTRPRAKRQAALSE